MIEVYPITIEAIDTDCDGKPVFTLETFDEHTATLKIDTLVAPGKPLDELIDAIRRGVDMLKLKEG